MRIILALLLTGIAVVFQEIRGQDHCPLGNPNNCSSPPTYYEINGHCNNVTRERAGSESSPYARVISSVKFPGAPNYKSFFGYDLPTPRNISRELFSCHGSNSTSDTSHLFAIFAKLLQHDLFYTERNSTPDSCCASCYGIDTNINSDPRTTNCPCINYYKPTLVQDIDCNGAETEGKNRVTHVIDASFIYGSVHYTGNLTNGTFPVDAEKFLLTTSNQFNDVDENIRKCPLQMALYHVFVREHNKLVEEVTPFTSSPAEAEAIAKKILIGIFQRIVYNEFLPILLGVQIPNTPTGYPIITNAFSLAYKLAVVSMLRKSVTLGSVSAEVKDLNDSTSVDSAAELKDIIVGLLGDCSYEIGTSLPCFSSDECSYPDIVSVLTQDSRYLAVSPYYIFLAIHGNPPPASLDLLTATHTPAGITELKKVYSKIFDVDFLSGSFTETIVPPSKLGKTLTKIFLDQFAILRDGDRFFYDKPNIFTSAQLAEINKITLKHLLCRNVVGLTEVKQEPFKCGNSTLLQCTALQGIDFCNFFGNSNWTPFTVLQVQCVLFQIQTRTCLSPDPARCPCIGVPFKIVPCPGNIVEPEIIFKYKMLEQLLAEDEDAIQLLYTQKYELLGKRVHILYQQL